MLRLWALVVGVLAATSVAVAQGPGEGAESLPTHEARAQAVLQELAALGFEVDAEQLSIEVRELEECVEDLDRQQDLFFQPTHYDALAGLVWATSPEQATPPPSALIRRSAVQNAASKLGAYYQFDRQALVFPKSFLGALNDAMGARDALIAHELTHAHQAQREGGLAAILHRGGRSVERVRVAQCLLEGEAELVALAVLRARQGGSLDGVTEADLDAVADLNEALVGALDQVYDLGRRAVLAAYQDGGWEAVRRLVHEDQPASTEQLLHAAKRGQDTPEEVALPDAPAGYELVHDGSYGELQILQILGAGFPDRGEQASIGWDGDRMRLFHGPDGAQLFVWRTVWDRDEDAEQFAALLDVPFMARQGRVVDLLRGSDEQVAAAYRASLPAWEREADPRDAETTAAAERALEAREAARRDRRDGQRWELPAAGVAFELPEGFETSRQGATHIAALTQPAEPFQDGIDFTDNVTVIVMANPLGDDYETHVKLNREQIAGIPGLELIALEQGEVAGKPALVGRYAGVFQPGSPPMEFRLILLLRGQQQVVITGVNATARREQTQPLIDQLLDSLTWLGDD